MKGFVSSSDGVKRACSAPQQRLHSSLALQWGKGREGNLGEEEIALYVKFFFKNLPVYNKFHIMDSQWKTEKEERH